MHKEDKKWEQYYRNIYSAPHNRETEAAERFNQSGNYIAVDCGCGAGNDIDFLVSKGYVVHGFDINPRAVEVCEQRFQHDSNVRISEASFSSFEYPEAGLVVANASLFFSCPANFNEAWRNIVSSIAPGGVFCGGFIGHRDSWVTEGSDYTLNPMDKTEVIDLFSGFTIEELEEFDGEGKTVLGNTKNWHIYRVIAKKNV